MNINILRYDTLGSTNTEAAEQARRGADEGLCVIANQQTAGRGRHGRTWISVPDSGLYFSIVLRPKIRTRRLPLLTLMAGVAVHDLLMRYGLDADIKWVNDILINEKKICGILAETVDTPTGLAVVVGVGINLKSKGVTVDLAETATSIEAERAGNDLPISELEAELIKFLGYWYELLLKPYGPSNILFHWQWRSSCVRERKEVRVTLPNGIIEGIADGLEANGALRVKLADGSVRIVQAGDVERLRTT